MRLNDANINSLVASIMVEELVRCGVRLFCLSPGSRCTPLTAAIARHPDLHTTVHFDERGSAFYALGHARATGQPAVVVCTSGTAVANLLPAVVEALMDMIPLIILSADRPPELRDTGANQTIRQANMFHDYVRWQFDLPCPDEKLPSAFWLTTIDQAVYRTQRSPAGPVHLNCMFREPLAPLPDGSDLSVPRAALAGWLDSEEPFTSYSVPQTVPESRIVDDLVSIISNTGHGLLIVGSLRSRQEQKAARALSQKLGWPTFPDIRSGLRLVSEDKQTVPYYDLFLHSESFAQHHRPGVILQIGSRLVSKGLLQYIERLPPPEYIVVDNHPDRTDPDHRVTRRIESDVVTFCNILNPFEIQPIDSAWHTALRKASRTVESILETTLSDRNALSEPAVVRLVSRHAPRESGLFLASSMSIRLMDMYAAPTGNDVQVGANRGASGIDGTMASAAGFAAGINRPTTLLIGDLALLHDLNSLALLEKTGVPVTIVVLNNNGGGIFDFLPVAECQDIVEPFFTTPHGKTFAEAASMFNLAYALPESAESFVTAYQKATDGDRSSLIEVPIDRHRSFEVHQEIRGRIVRELSGKHG